MISYAESKSKLSGIFQVKVATKIQVFGSLGTQTNLLCSMMSLFEETYKFSDPNYYT